MRTDPMDGAGLGLGEVQGFGVQEFDAMNRRKKIGRDDGTRWNYDYNSKGEVTSGQRELGNAPNTAVPGWNYLKVNGVSPHELTSSP